CPEGTVPHQSKAWAQCESIPQQASLTITALKNCFILVDEFASPDSQAMLRTMIQQRDCFLDPINWMHHLNKTSMLSLNTVSIPQQLFHPISSQPCTKLHLLQNRA
ncbi:hypothetical protein MJO28_010444, partial [Puccinia striiformis f. sp. tritici]